MSCEKNYRGYHGTLKTAMEMILTNGFVARHNDCHYLGQGIYFFEDIALAKWWAIEQKKRDGGEIAILSAELVGTDGKILDLTLIDHKDRFTNFFDSLLRHPKQYNNAVTINGTDENSTRKFLAMALDLYKESYDIEIVLANFEYKGNAVRFCDKLLSSYFISYSQKQICVTALCSKRVISNVCEAN